MGWLCGCLLEFLKFFCGTKRLSSWIRFDLVETMSDPEMSVILKLLKLLKKPKFRSQLKLTMRTLRCNDDNILCEYSGGNIACRLN